MTRSMRQNQGLITRAQLRALDFTSREIDGLLEHGELRRLHNGVYADGRAPLADTAYLRAALLAFHGRSPWLSGSAAAMGWGLEPVSVPRIEVTLVATATPRQRRDVRVRSVRVAPPAAEVRRRNGLRLSSIPRMLIETAAAPGSDRERIQALIDAAARRKLLAVHDLAATVTRHAGRRGVALVQATCIDYLPHTDRKSDLELAFDRWLAKHPEIPPPERNVFLGPWELDCFWPDRGLALELDGRPYHVLIEEIERDHAKDAWLQVRAIRILRVTDSRFDRDRRGVYRDLATMLGLITVSSQPTVSRRRLRMAA